jgi:glutaredoxin
MKITIYTITDCQFSKQEKEYLATHNLPFEEKNLETNHEYLTEMLNVSNNFAGTPVTKLEKDDGSTVVLKGFTAEEFDKELGFAADGKPAEQPAQMPAEEKPKVEVVADQQNAAPPAAPPEMPTPQPPAPVPQPPTPQPPTPEVPVVPPTVPDQSAQPSMDLPPLSMNNAPSVPQEPAAPVQPAPTADSASAAESTIDDASLDAILNQLQEKTAAPPANNQQQPPAPPAGAPTVPDFGSSS